MRELGLIIGMLGGLPISHFFEPEAAGVIA
jgi:hypothetical protein